MSESEFGTIVGALHGVDIIRTEDSKIVAVSEAFNPLNGSQLLDILQTMWNAEEPS